MEFRRIFGEMQDRHGAAACYMIAVDGERYALGDLGKSGDKGALRCGGAPSGPVGLRVA